MTEKSLPFLPKKKSFSLLPDIYVKNVRSLPFPELFRRGLRGLIFDIDNTVVPHDSPADEEAVSFIRRLKETGYRICFLSNNSEERVRPFAEALGAPFVPKGGKPMGKGYEKALRILNLPREEVLFLGDQVYTDVLGANMAGIPSCLSEPLHPKEEVQIVLKRFLEKPVRALARKRTLKIST